MYEHLRGGLRNQIPKFQNPSGPILLTQELFKMLLAKIPTGNPYIDLNSGQLITIAPQPNLQLRIEDDWQQFLHTDNMGQPIPKEQWALWDLQKFRSELDEGDDGGDDESGGDGSDDTGDGKKKNKLKLLLNKGFNSAKKAFVQNSELIFNVGMNAAKSWGTSGIEQSDFVNGINGGSNFLKSIPGVGKKASMLVDTLSTGLTVTDKLTGTYVDKYQANKDVVAKMGGSYGGWVDLAQKAEDATGKIYGGLGGGAGEARELGRNAWDLENKIASISNTYQDQLAMSGNNLNYLRYLATQNGGWNPSLMRSSKFGSKLERIRRITSKKPEEPVEEFAEDLWEPQLFKEGGTIEENIEEDIFSEDSWEPLLFLNGGKTRTIQELIEYAKLLNPRFILRLSEPPRGIDFIDDSGKKSRGSHYLESAGEYVIPRILEVDGELKFFNHLDAVDRALETGNFLKMSPSEAILFAELYKLGWPEFFNSFLKGGNLSSKLNETDKEETNQKNIIPDGALHKEKHHMENSEDLTKKGIPVIDNEGVQLAEIERDEIVFTLEVTKKLEDLYHKYYDLETSKKDDLAIEAGKILVYEILYNTIDKTGLISKCKEGGKLNET